MTALTITKNTMRVTPQTTNRQTPRWDEQPHGKVQDHDQAEVQGVNPQDIGKINEPARGNKAVMTLSGNAWAFAWPCLSVGNCLVLTWVATGV